MAEVSEQMEKGIKEGITMPGQEAQVEPSVDKEAAPTPAKVEETPASGEQTPAEKVAPIEPKTRFEDNPGFKNVLRQRDSFKSELQRAQEANQKLMDMLSNQSKAPATPPNEQEAAAKQLRQILGIDGLVEKLDSLDKRNADYSQRETDSAFDKEQEGIVKQCEKYGLDFQEVVPELRSWLDEHPYFGRLPGDYQPGFFDIAFKAIYFDKSAELGQKAAHAETLRQTKKLKEGNVESPSPTGSNTPKVFNSIRDKVKSMMDEGGGISF